MNSLTVVIGPMFSGKTSRLVHFASKWVKRGKKVAVIINSLDTRGYLSHNTNLKIDERVTLIRTQRLSTVDVAGFEIVGIDEAQFFDDLVETVISWIPTHKILVSGLDGDASQHPFGEILQLIPQADKVHRLMARCHVCEERAPFTRKIREDGKRIDIGGGEKYRPVCREHLQH